MTTATTIPTTPADLRAFMAGESFITGAQSGQYQSRGGGAYEVYRPGYPGRETPASEISDADALWLIRAGLYAQQETGTKNWSLGAALRRAMDRHGIYWAGGKIGPNAETWTWDHLAVA